MMRPAVARLIVFFLLLLATVTPGLAAETDELAKKILQRELALQKLNDRLHAAAANPSFSRARRTWAWDMGNALPTEGGLIAATAIFFGHSRNRGQIAGTIMPQIAGQVVGGSGSFFELYKDWQRALKLRREGLDRNSVMNKVLSLKSEIDPLLVRYDTLSTNDAFAAAEAKILKDIRKNSLSEFARLEKGAALISAGQLIEDVASAGRNTVGAVGNSINVAGIYRDHKRLNGSGSILNLLAASTITVRPFVSNAGCWLATHASRKRTVAALGESCEERSDDLSRDLQQLKMLAQAGGAGSALAQRISVYTMQIDRDVEEKALAFDESKNAKQLITRRFRESIYGPTKMAQSTMSIIVNYRSEKNLVADDRMSGAANLTYTAGQVFNILELLRERVVDESRHSLEVKAKMLPQQRIDRQTEAVVHMERQLDICE